MSYNHILIVDDSAVWAAAVTAFLRHNGYRADVARDGAAALARAREQRPDLIILDLAMPVSDGPTFLRALRAERPPLADVPVLVVSGVTDSRTAAEVAALGVVYHLVKANHSLRELHDAIRASLPECSRRAA